jgi:hypothetical protein
MYTLHDQPSKSDILIEIQKIHTSKNLVRLHSADKKILVKILQNLKHYEQTKTWLDQDLVRLYLRATVVGFNDEGSEGCESEPSEVKARGDV